MHLFEKQKKRKTEKKNFAHHIFQNIFKQFFKLKTLNHHCHS